MSAVVVVFFLALGAALLLFVVLELGARWALRRWGGYYRYQPHWRMRHVIDPNTLPNFPPVSMVETNADGERGDAPPTSGERAFRILVAGGSAAECYMLDQGATWGAVVQRILSRPENLATLGVSRVHVGNVGRAILPCEQIAYMLEKILPRYRRLDAILIMVGAADAVSWIERGMPKTVASGQIVLDKIFEQHPEGPWGWKPKKTALWRLARSVDRAMRRPLNHDQRGDWLARVRKMRAEAPHRIDEVPDAAPMLAHMEKGLTSLLQVALRKTKRVILVRQPWFAPNPTPEEERMMWNFGLGRPYREQVDTYFTPRVVDALMRTVDERAARVATSLGVEQIDLVAVLDRGARTFHDELHFTPQGAEDVGRLVADVVLAGGAGPRSAAS